MIAQLKKVVLKGARPQTSRAVTTQYFVATVAFLLAVATRYAAAPLLPPSGFPFLIFFPTVLLVSFFTSLGPSLWCAALSTVAAWTLFMAPPGQIVPHTAADLFALVFFAAILVVDCVVISVMKNALWQLNQAEGELRLADRRKDDFLALMAHELRNPLNVIRMTTRLLSKKVDFSLAGRVEMLDAQSAQMQRLIDDLLDTARITTGKIKVKRSRIDLREVLESTATAFQLLSVESEQVVECASTDAPIWVDGDRSRLVQIFENLLSNASKFSPPGAKHRISVKTDQHHVNVSVIDEGRGLAPDQTEKIFGMYVQANSSDARLGGLGLGLALAKRIAELHDGSLTAFSAGIGHGATLVVRLPLAPAPNTGIGSKVPG